ncbi:MAG: aspartyl-phosphate phosphatase Spo0E family protein [Desulfitobacteriaceae bacterium]
MEEILLQRIEELRTRLHNFAHTESLVAPEIVELSQRLDSLLNQYHQCIIQHN